MADKTTPREGLTAQPEPPAKLVFEYVGFDGEPAFVNGISAATTPRGDVHVGLYFEYQQPNTVTELTLPAPQPADEAVAGQEPLTVDPGAFGPHAGGNEIRIIRRVHANVLMTQDSLAVTIDALQGMSDSLKEST